MLELILIIFVAVVLLTAPIMFRIMRSNRSNIEADSSSSEAEEILSPDKSLDTDAVNPERYGDQYPINITIANVRDIEDSLEVYEKISLIFLLSDNPQDCIDKIELSKWAQQEMIKCSSWQKKLWEALAIIKNFQIPKKYGYFKKHLIEEYFPFQYFTTKYVSRYKKVLFFICEHFNQADEKLFLQHLKRDFEQKQLRFVEYSQMEMYFSYLLKIAYISPGSTKNCLRIAKVLDMEQVYDYFKFIDDSSVNKMRKPILNKKYFNTMKNISSDERIGNDRHYLSIANSDSTQDNIPMVKTSEDTYSMDGSKLCLIIDQENFFTELDSQYKHLLPEYVDEDEGQLHPRLGTKEDSDRLKFVLKKRGFLVKIVRNLNHLRMIQTIKHFLSIIDETCSCFFVIILSHGNKDVVYGVNSCYVEISRIISLMDNKKHNNIPKALILQACQGSNLMKHVDENLTTDGASAVESSDLKSPNFILFSSTVPGFASIRDKKKGTWFIQSFCDQIENYADTEHFQDICTRVTDDVGNNKWRRLDSSYQMLPYLKSTLFKKLYI